LDNFDFKYVAIGYRHALNKKDTLLKDGERASLLTKFQTEVQTAQMNKMKTLDKPFLDNAKSLPNTRTIDGGIVIETIQEGKGGSPAVSDEVIAHYILTNPKGDTLESSFDRNQPLTIGLQSVIPGWTMSFPQLKKGGKYRLFIPSELAYGNGALCFYVELINFGAAGTVK
jgi:FKBP-type peptidyl-prolyl cis-trans isomerase